MLPSLADLTNAGYGAYIQQLEAQGYSASDALLQAAFKQSVDAIHGLATTLAAFQKQNNAQGIADTKTQLEYWQVQLQTAQSAVNQAETPAAILQTLSAFSDDATSVLQDAGVGVGGTLSALGSLLKNLPLILGLTVVVLVGFYLWKYRVLEREGA